MDGDDCPYGTLGVPRDATLQQIKSAYRKLALRHHPDKQRTEEERRRSSEVFTRISNAYEILSDEGRRMEHDSGRSTRPASGGSGFGDDCFGGRRGQEGRFGADPFDDPFFRSAFFGGSRASSSPGRGFGGVGGGFSDPFEIFERVFGEEFGTGATRRRNQNGGGGGGRSFFDDPFADDPFFSGGGMGGFGSMSGMMSSMSRQMDLMNQAMDMQRSMFSGHGPHDRFSSYSSSAASSPSGYGGGGRGRGRGGGGGLQQSVSTTTRIVGGQRETVTERTVVHPDGTVERHVETTTAEDDGRIGHGGGGRGTGFIERDHAQCIKRP